MLLTIGILFCNKDIEYLPTLLKNIKDKVFIEYEVILLDNRNTFETDISFLDEYTVLNKEQGNLYQLVGRKKIIEQAQGKYIWFVDADDDVFPIDESFLEIIEKDIDINIFSYLGLNGEEQVWAEEQNADYTGDLLRPDCYKLSCLWNKWIKADKLKEVAKLVPDNVKVSASEDNFYNLVLLKICNSLSYHNKYIYTFNYDRSCSGYNDYSNNLEKYKRCFFGLEDANKLIRTYLSEEELKKLKLNIDKSDCNFFLRKVFQTTDKETQSQMFEIIKTHFSDELLKEMYNELLDTLEFTEESYKQIYNLFYKYYGDDFGYIEVETTYVFDTGTEVRQERVAKTPTKYKEIKDEDIN